MAIPKQFDCMGFTIPVVIEEIRAEDLHGEYDVVDPAIRISKESAKQVQEQTFWHEYVHCALTTLGYSKLNKDEKFVDRMGQCLYQLERSRKERRK